MHSHSTHSNYGLTEPLLRGDLSRPNLTIPENVEEEDKFASITHANETIHTEEDLIGQIPVQSRKSQHKQMSLEDEIRSISQDPTQLKKSQQIMSLEDEIRSISQGMVYTGQTPTNERMEGISQELDLVRSSLHQQQSLESQLEQKLSIDLHNSSNADYNKGTYNEMLMREPEIMALSLQNPLHSTSTIKPFMSSNFFKRRDPNSTSKLHISSSANRDINHVRTEKSSFVSKTGRSQTKQRQNSKQPGIKHIAHKKGCPAHVNSAFLASRSSTILSNDKQNLESGRRTRNLRIQKRSEKKRDYATSKSSKRSQSIKSKSKSRSRSNNDTKSGSKGQAKKQPAKPKNVKDAACSPIRCYGGTFGTDASNKEGFSRSSSAANIDFVAQTSYRSSIQAIGDQKYKAPEKTQTPERHAGRLKGDLPLSQRNQNFLVRNELGNSNPNIFSIGSTELKSQQYNPQQVSSSRVVAWAKNPIAASSNDLMTNSYRVSENIRLTQTTVQVRQALQEAAEMTGAPQRVVNPQQKLQLNLKLLRRKEKQNQMRSSIGSVKTFISAGLDQPSSATTSNHVVFQHHPNCEMGKRKGPSSREQHKGNQGVPTRCAICSLSSFTVHPSVYKAKQRVKERKFIESHKELTQHLRNPMTVAKQLRRHLKLQETVKNQFEAFVGQTGHKSLLNLNRVATAATSNFNQPLRQQSHWLGKRDQRSVLSGPRSEKAGGGRKKREIVRLRYAPHLISSQYPQKVVDDARGAINIIVNERRRRSSSQENYRHSRSKSKESAGGKNQMHKMLSGDDYKPYGGDARKIRRNRSERSFRSVHVEVDNAYQIQNSKKNVSSTAQFYRSRPYSERSCIDPSLNAMYSSSPDPEYRTGHFKLHDTVGLKGSIDQLTQQPLRLHAQSNSNRSQQKLTGRELKQRARLDQILKEKRNQKRKVQIGSASSQALSDQQRSEAFNVYENSRDLKIQPLRNQPHRSRSRQHRHSFQSQSYTDSRERRQSQIRSSQRSKSDHNRSKSAYSGSRSSERFYSETSSRLHEQEKASYMPSYEKLPKPQSSRASAEQNNVADIIANDKSGSLRLRIQKAKDLVQKVDRGIKDIRNMNSPLSNHDKRVILPLAGLDGNYGDANSEAQQFSNLITEPRMSNSNQEITVTDRKESDSVERAAEHPSNHYQKQKKTPLRQHVADERKPSPRLSYMDRIYDRSQGQSDEGRFKSGSRSRSRSSGKQENLQSLPRHTFMREVSGVKYDYRPIPREDGRDFYHRNSAEQNARKTNYRQDQAQTRSQPRTYTIFDRLSSQYSSVPQSIPHEIPSGQQVIDRVQKEFFNGSFPPNSTYFRIKQNRIGAQQYSQSCRSQGHLPIQAETTKFERSRSKSKSREKLKYKPYQADFRLAKIPKIKNFRDCVKKRARPVSFESFSSSSLNDFDSVKRRVQHIDTRNGAFNPTIFKLSQLQSPRQLSQERRLCSGSRCSASKENVAQNYDFEGARDRQTRENNNSRSKSRGSANQKLKTLSELKQSIRRLQKPTFSSKMHLSKKPDYAMLDKNISKSKQRGEPQLETPHCDRDPIYWQREVEAFSNSFSSHPNGVRNKNGPASRARSPLSLINLVAPMEKQLMPLKQLKQISKVMNDIMGVDKQVQKLKQHLEKIIKSANSVDSA